MYQEEELKRMDDLIDLYLTGQADREQLTRLKDWCGRSESNRRYVRNRVEVWQSSGELEEGMRFDADRGFRRFRERVSAAPAREKAVRRIRWSHWARVAAAVLALAVPFWTYHWGKDTVKRRFADIAVEAPRGARTKLYLPDGTLVWLNAGSRLVYSQGFGMDGRCLSLEGEGYFEVTKGEMPFEVRTKELGLRVLGTKFNFKNYPEDEEVTVSLMSGKVSLRNEVQAMPEVCLCPDERMVLDKRTGAMIKSKAKADHANAWARNELFFDEETLEDIARKLMRTYDVQIDVADSLKEKRFYGSFKITKNTVGEVLDVLASTNRMKYRYESGKYMLY